MFVTDYTSYGGNIHKESTMYYVCIQRETRTEQHAFFKARYISRKRLNNIYCFIVLIYCNYKNEILVTVRENHVV